MSVIHFQSGILSFVFIVIIVFYFNVIPNGYHENMCLKKKKTQFSLLPIEVHGLTRES